MKTNNNKLPYAPPRCEIMKIETTQMIAMSGDVSVGGWGDGGSLGGGEAEEGANGRRGTWGNLWD